MEASFERGLPGIEHGSLPKGLDNDEGEGPAGDLFALGDHKGQGVTGVEDSSLRQERFVRSEVVHLVLAGDILGRKNGLDPL